MTDFKAIGTTMTRFMEAFDTPMMARDALYGTIADTVKYVEDVVIPDLEGNGLPTTRSAVAHHIAEQFVRGWVDLEHDQRYLTIAMRHGDIDEVDTSVLHDEWIEYFKCINMHVVNNMTF